MKKNNFITGIAIFVLFFASNAFSACDFQFNLGDDKDEIVNKIQSRPFPLEHVGLEVVPILADDICPEQKLTDVGIELRGFLCSNEKSPSSSSLFFSASKAWYNAPMPETCNFSTTNCICPLNSNTDNAP